LAAGPHLVERQLARWEVAHGAHRSSRSCTAPPASCCSNTRPPKSARPWWSSAPRSRGQGSAACRFFEPLPDGSARPFRRQGRRREVV